MITTTCWILWIPTRLRSGAWLVPPHAAAAAHASRAPATVAETRPTRTRSLRSSRQPDRGRALHRAGLPALHLVRRRFCPNAKRPRAGGPGVDSLLLRPEGGRTGAVGLSAGVRPLAWRARPTACRGGAR